MRRTKAEAEQTRQDILHTALQLFDEQGYAATTLVQIAKQVGLTRGSNLLAFQRQKRHSARLGRILSATAHPKNGASPAP